MARAPSRRERTGNRRRGPKRNHTRLHRHMHLSQQQVGFMDELQRQALYEGGIAFVSILTVPQLLFLYAHVRDTIGDDYSCGLVVSLLELMLIRFMVAVNNFQVCQRFDYFLHDIPPEEEAEVALPPRQNIRFDSWSDQDCYDKTSFTKVHLQRIYDCFALEAIANQPGNNGFIKVPTGFLNNNGVPCCYNFHPEELFLYFMMRMRSGNDHTQMCHVFGGSVKRWSYAWKWIIHYLDKRYANIIGHQGLLRFVDQFPAFFEAIQQKVQREFVHNVDEENGTYDVTDGLAFLPFDIFGFIDCSIDKICCPFSGPRGDYEGSGRREEYDIMQRAFYTGYKKLHGIKVETVFLPNGMSTLFGPVSARLTDVENVLQMSQLNTFLVHLQQGRQHEYQALGDGVYGTNLRCIRSYFKSRAGQPPLTDQQRRCNAAIKKCRQSIEWNYGKVSRDFEICSHPKHNMIGKKNPYAIEQLRVAHLLTNISICLKGDQASGRNMFDCDPPRLEDYLRL